MRADCPYSPPKIYEITNCEITKFPCELPADNADRQATINSAMAKTKSKRAGKRWVATVTSDSTDPPEGLFTKDAATIARSLASKKVSPKGPGSGMRMLTYFINRGGKGLSATRRRELEKAKKLLSEKIKRERERKAA